MVKIIEDPIDLSRPPCAERLQATSPQRHSLFFLSSHSQEAPRTTVTLAQQGSGSCTLTVFHPR